MRPQAALKVSQLVAEFMEPRAVPLSLAEGSTGCLQTFVPGAVAHRPLLVSSFKFATLFSLFALSIFRLRLSTLARHHLMLLFSQIAIALNDAYRKIPTLLLYNRLSHTCHLSPITCQLSTVNSCLFHRSSAVHVSFALNLLLILLIDFIHNLL